MVVEQADQITKNQEYLRRMDIILDTPEVVEEDD